MFKTRLTILTALFGLCCAVVLGRLWQLQISRYDRYRALSTRDKSFETIIQAMRGLIVDRYGDVLALDKPSYDLSVRVDRLKLENVSLEDVKAMRSEKLTQDEVQSRIAQITEKLRSEPFVRNLAQALKRGDDDVAAGVFRAFDSAARNWTSPRAPVRIAGGIDEKNWIALRAAHEDVFRDSRQMLGKSAKLAKDEVLIEPPFPGLVCTISTRRFYPHGRLACFPLGYVGELTGPEEEALRSEGVLIENQSGRSKFWSDYKDNLDESTASQLNQIFGRDPREIEDLGQLCEALGNLKSGERELAAQLGLGEALRWIVRPPRIRLAEPERVWLGVGMPTNSTRNGLPSRIIGEGGIERIFNESLRGKSGMKLRENFDDDDDPAGFRRNAQPKEGDAIALTISSTWQSAVERALMSQDRPGAAVVIDIHTGEVLAMASYPDFDPNLFVPPRDGPDRQEKLKALLNDPNKPLLNRVISEQYPLGSVMKSLIAAVALERGVVTLNETFECPGYIVEGGQRFHCDEGRAHGTVNLIKGIRCSCNVTFHQLGARIGVENLSPYARMFFGRRMGIDLPSEASGVYPDRAWRTKTFPNNAAARLWTKGNDFQLAIGQGQMNCTVLQAAVLMAAIGNGGYVLTPRMWLDAPKVAPAKLPVGDANLASVRIGLDEVCNSGRPGERGTAYAAFHDQGPALAIPVAGKTSTAEHKKGEKPHAWFAGYAPANNPQVAFAVVLEEAGHGGSAAAPVVCKFLREVYGTKNAPVANPGAPKQVVTK